MNDEAVLECAGTLTLADLARFQYFHANRRGWIISLICISLLMFALATAVLAPFIEGITNTTPFVLLVLFWCFMVLGNPYIAAYRQWKAQQFLREPQQFRVDPNVLELEGPNFSGKISWALVHAVYETKTLFLIYQSAQVAWIIPKRFFAAASKQEAWARYAQTHVVEPKNYHRQNRIGSLL